VQVPIPKTAAEVPGPVPGNLMTKEYVQLVGRMAYVWGYPLVKHFNFECFPGFHHSIVLLLPASSLARLKAIRTIGHAMSCKSVEQLLVEMVSVCAVTVALHGDQ
jgi:hypothetical protein